MIGMVLVGATIGALVFGLIVTLIPAQRSTLVQLGQYYAHFGGPEVADVVTYNDSASLRDRLGLWSYTRLARTGMRFTRLRSDLALTGQSIETLMGRKVVAAVGGLIGGLLALGAMGAAGLTVPTGAPLVVSATAAVALFIAPDIDVRNAAARRRREFAEQLSVFLDLVSLRMAAHAAAAAALPEAAQRGGGWPMLLIRDTLWHAQRSGTNEWTALSQLGERIGVSELRDLGALIKLVADDGAQVRSTLVARAASMRRARLADEESNAAERSQLIRLAQLLIALGFMVFVGYPAFANINF